MQQESVRVLVTGGTGFLGKHLIPHLIHDCGLSVYALARNIPALPSEVVDTLHMDLRDMDEQLIVSFLNTHSINVVVHLAALMDFYPTNSQEVFLINCTATRILALACAKANTVTRFVYCSSTETIGGVLPHRPFPCDEDTPCNPNYIYGESKVESEKIIKDIHRTQGLDYVILRPTGLFGVGDDFAIYELIKAVDFGLFFFTPGAGIAKLMFTHVEDAAQAIALSITSPRAVNNTFIICPDDVMTYEEWVTMLAQHLGRTPPLFHLPLPVVKLTMHILGPLFNIGKRRVFLFQPRTCDRMIEDRWYSNNKAKQLLGFKPKFTLRDGLRETVNEYRSSHTRLPVSPTMVILGLFGVILCLYVIALSK